MKLFRIVFLILLFFSFLSVQAQSSCTNADFELGNFNGWSGQTGTCCPISTTPSAIITGRHTIMTGTGTDPNTCNNVRVVAPGGTYSARLGNANTGRQAEKLTYTIPVVDASNALFIYKYAVVLQDPSHTAVDQPRFELKILNASGQVIDPVCGYYLVVADDNIPGFQNCGNVVYKNWTTVGIDLTPYIGQQISLVFATGDCDLGAHFGYAYIDAYCSPLSIISNYCSNSTSATLSAPPGFSYLWNTGETSQSITITNPTVGTIYSCTLTSVTGCIVTLTATLSIGDPNADFNIINNCFSNAVFSSATSQTPPTTSFTNFLWNFGDGTTSTNPNPTHSFPSPGNYTVTLTLTNSSGCVSIKSYLVTVIEPPTAIINYPSPSYCITNSNIQSVTLSGTGAFTGGTYSSLPSGLSINTLTGEITPSASTPGNYTVTYTKLSSVGCASVSVTTNVIIYALPTAMITYVNSPFCISLTTEQAVTLTGTGVYTGGIYSVTPTGLSINSSTGAINPSTSNPGNYVVTYTTLSSGGCTAIQATTIVVVNPIPIATATLLTNTICTLTPTNITLSSNIVGTTFNWTVSQTNVTGATNGTGVNINQILTNTSFIFGTVNYLITPIANGCFGNTIQSIITVKPMPDVIAYPSIQNICTGQSTSINLSGNVTGTTYNWTVTQVDVLGASSGSGNSITQILNTISTNYGVANYTVTPTANNCIGNPIVVPINITPKPVIVASPNLQTICSGDPITPIILTSNISGTTYNWTVTQTNVSGAINGSGSSISQALTNNSNIQGQVLYTINSTLNNCPGNSSSALVNVNPSPLVNSNTINQTICSNENTNITLTSTVSNTLFSWTVTQNNVTGALSGSGNNINQTLANNTTIIGLATYNVTPIATGCSGLPLLISVNVKPKPRLTNNLNTTICSLQTTNIPLTSNIVGSTFSWTATTTGPTGFSNAQGNTIAQQLQNNANYYGTVTYNVTPTNNGCNGVESSISVKVNPLPKPNLVDGTICKDSSGNTIRNFILDTGLSNTNHSFNWNFNGTPIPNYFQNPYMATQIGVYSVYAINNTTGCRSNPEVSASITEVNPATKLFAYVNNNLSGNSDITIVVQSGTGPFQYQLDNGVFQNSNVFSSVSPGQHNITVLDTYNCTNLITKAMVLDYPNYFTPNGDNYNDNWNIYGIQSQPSAKIYIFDRYGKFISQVNPLGIGWDGNYNGRPLPASDYWFVLEYLEKDYTGVDTWRTFKSHFSLLR